MFSPDAPAEAGGAEADASQRRSYCRRDEPPEPLVGGTVDLGAIATEFLILGIDPYPRKPGAEFDAPPRRPGEASIRSRRWRR